MRHFSRAERRELPLFERGTLEYWQRREVLVALMHPTGCAECEALEGALRVHEQALPARDAVLVRVALGRGAPPGWREDADGHIAEVLADAANLAPGTALLTVGTRFGRLAAVGAAHGLEAAALVTEALEALHLAQVQCEDCSEPLPWD